jgi:hypothetical protein
MIFEITVLVCLALFVGWRLSAWWHTMVFKKMLDDLGVNEKDLQGLHDRLMAEDVVKELLDTEKPKPQADRETVLPELEVVIEQQPEGLFAYRKRDWSFIARGADREELMANLVNNLTNVRVTVAKEDGADLISS